MPAPHPPDKHALLPDILGRGLDVVFVGAAPSYRAAAIGHYYPGPHNRFWQLLHQAGFTPRRLEPEEDHTVVAFGVGLTAILPGEISTDNALLPPATEEDVALLRAKLERAAPKVVCWNGKDVYRMFSGEPDCPWGLLEERLGTSLQYVVPSSSGRADRWGAERLALWRELRDLVNALRAE